MVGRGLELCLVPVGIRRGILADSAEGQFVYAISDAGVRSAKVASLPAWLQTVKFPPLVYNAVP